MSRFAELEVTGTTARLVLRGEIDLLAVPEVRSALDRAREGRATAIDVDLAAVDFIDSSGLGVLAEAAAELTLRIVAAPITITRILEMTGLGDLLQIGPGPEPR